MVSNRFAVTALMAAAGLFSGQVLAQTTPAAPPAAAPAASGFTLELNNVRDDNDVCRITYVVVVFDAESRVSQFLILEFGNVPVGKTKVRQFNIENSKCSDISRVLVNNASKCSSEGKPLPVCLDTLTTSSRTNIVFGL